MAVEKRQDATLPLLHRHRGWSIFVAVLLAFALLAVLVAIAGVLGNRAAPPDRPLQKVELTAQQFERGRYLARAADCAACHQTADGAAFAGGFPLKTPFGTVYGTNITPHPDRGIGRWNADEFYRAVTLGKAPGGRNLYPAMPYVSYHHMARADADLIYGYLMNVRPSPQINRAPDLPFPVNQRMVLSGWNLLFFDKAPLPVASQGQSVAWERGRYLSNVMGHCAECHTPRGAGGQLQRGAWLQGYALSRLLAPDLLPAGLAGRGWTLADLQRFMRDGVSPQGSANGEMLPVIQHSSQYLNDADLAAMATFLLGDVAPSASSPPPPAPDLQRFATGRKTYLNVCAGCHGAAGEGLPNTIPALVGNSTVRQVDPRNLIVTVLDGLPEQRFPHGMVMSDMPGFSRRLTDAEIRDVVNYSRAAWGGRPGDVTAETVGRYRVGK